MPKHQSEDYKISAVHYYIENDTYFTETCRIFKCSERSLKRWINRYKTDKSIKRHSRKAISYKVTQEQVKYAIKKLKKNEMNYHLSNFYEKQLYRKLKLNGYWNRLKSEQKLLNQFKKIFGKPEETIVCFGDYEQRTHMKYKEAIKGKGMRTLFKKNCYKTYLVDEFRTSCKCSKCNDDRCEKFMVRENPKPFRINLRLVHELISCKRGSNVWNRDCNCA